MKRNLLSIVQDLLYDLDGDEVSSISDTIESLQVAHKVRAVYEELNVKLNLPATYTFYELIASGDPSKPTVMTLPSIAESLEELRYNIADIYDTTPRLRQLQYKEMDEFLDLMYGTPTDGVSNVGSFTLTLPNTATIEFLYKNNKFPQYYTTFDDVTVIFDSYDASYDTTLVGSKSVGYGKTQRPFTLDDSFVPDLPSDKFPLLYQEARKACFYDMKQVENTDAIRRARSQLVTTQIHKQGIKDPLEGFRRAPNYAR